MSAASQQADVVIVGGAVVGSAVAYFLARDPDFWGSVIVIERDPTYATASTTLSAASVRQQFSTPVNIQMSQFALQVLKHPDWWFPLLETVPEFDFVEGGYLFLATQAGVPTLWSNNAIQREHQVSAEILSPDELSHRFPWLNTEDIAGGSLGLAGEGWFDAAAMMQAFQQSARASGVTYVTGEVTGILSFGGRIDAVMLADGRLIECGALVNAAGPRAGALARFAGVDLPVVPRKRNVYSFSCKTEINDAPLVIDPTGVYFRPDAPNFIGGFSPREGEEDPDTLDLSVDLKAWEERVWPAIAHRVPAFEAVKMRRAWAGHYEVNTVDHNAIIGPHPDIPNLLFANGFSGHGLQQAPAVGRGLAELVIHGAYRTIDLTPLGYERIAANRPLRELNVV
ncbi:MAG TPA: FAD-binding oxidoreductase [Candidatus Limnocylindria bacterium]|jgi:sarcosine oxidase|nr:FAD-binding oxidoreductase [Candidatus Limnocylindria bacterium]